ncbi:sensor histidine kinase [Streptococcus dentiloxodontae]
MKKQYLLLIISYAIIVVLGVSYFVLASFERSFDQLLKEIPHPERLIINIIFLILGLVILLFVFWSLANDNSMRGVNKDLRRIINNQPIQRQAELELDKNLIRLSHKVRKLTADLQKTENRQTLKSQDIIKKERSRIARDLHDTVSQELFAASMILSGVSQTLDQLDQENLRKQLKAVEDILTDAQNDLRVLLLHLRPTELENKSLKEGLLMILKELTDKSNIRVLFKCKVKKVPKRIEDNLFRIAQEFISNTLKHAKANQLEVYLYQNNLEIQLKMLDDGIGYDLDVSTDELSYGLKNIQERVDDMAGNVSFLSAKGKGTSMDIRVPILKGEKNDEN